MTECSKANETYITGVADMATPFNAVNLFDRHMEATMDNIAHSPNFGVRDITPYEEGIKTMRHCLVDFVKSVYAMSIGYEPDGNRQLRRYLGTQYFKGFVAARKMDIMLTDAYLINKKAQLRDNTMFESFWNKMCINISKVGGI